VSVYQRGENWYVDFVFKGQRIRESIGPSRKDAEKVIAKKKTEIIENKYLDIRKDPDPITFHAFGVEYLKWAKTNKKPSSYGRDLSSLRALDKDFETKILQDITSWQIEKYKTKRKEQVKPASINRELALIKHLYSKAIEWGKCKENPARKVKLLRGEVNRVRYLVPEEVQTLLSNCMDHLRPIVTVAVHTGMRKGELLGLEWARVNFEQGFITLFDTKNHERRDIPMNKTVKETLLSMERKDPHVFPSRNGRIFVDIRDSFGVALKKSGITDFRFHDLRHTFASNLVMAGEDLNTVRELMGHKTMAMTLRYSHLSPGKKAKAVNVLDEIMSQIPPHSEKSKKVVRLMP
jgi:integrase